MPTPQALTAEHLAIAASADDAAFLSGRLVSVLSSSSGLSPLPLSDAMLLLPMSYSVASGGAADENGGALPYEDEASVKVGSRGSLLLPRSKGSGRGRGRGGKGGHYPLPLPLPFQ